VKNSCVSRKEKGVWNCILTEGGWKEDRDAEL
jgi:hypothetical protein